MEKGVVPPPPYDAQPPPYSEIAPPHTVQPPAPSIHSVPTSMNLPPPNQFPPQYEHCVPEAIVHTRVVTRQSGATVHIVTSSPLFGPNPRTIVCTSCRQTVSSKIVRRQSIGAHVLALSLCMVGCWPCAPFVYCSNCCMNVNHHCSNCDSYQGTFIPSY